MVAPFAVILPAAGRSTRFGGPTNKLLADLCGEPVLARSLRAFLERGDVTRVVLATAWPADALRAASGSLADCLSDRRVMVCPGSESRAESVRAGLAYVDPATEWVAVHDAARPLVEQALVDRVLRLAMTNSAAAAPARPVVLTVKEADGPLPTRVRRTLSRQALWAMQTPQVSRRSALLDAFGRCPVPLHQITDEAQLLELAGHDVWLVEGDDRNLKITTALDLDLARLLLGSRNQPS